MFNLRKSARQEKSLSVTGVSLILDSQSQIKGDLLLNSDIRIDGILEGNITTTGSVIIGEKGSFLGKVISNNFFLFGHFNGDADITMRSVIHRTGKFYGRMVTEIINIESGGFVNASILMRSFVSQMQHQETDFKSTILKEERNETKVRLMQSPEVAEARSFLLKNLGGF
ncbi:MAG: hypothetical protein RI909_543 [Bacteroidota bacterium]